MSPHSASGYTILVVDDQRTARLATRKVLQSEGHGVLLAESGEQALALFKEHDVHLVVVDWRMPGMCGSDLVREIRRFDPTVQVILQTGFGREAPARELVAELDIQGFHDKMRGPSELLMWVDIGLRSHRLIHRLSERERLQAELVANVSHEFRTPLNVIGGYTELLLEGECGPMEPEAARTLSRIREASRDLGHLVGDFLSYARVEAEVEATRGNWIEMDALSDEMERLACVLVGHREIEVLVDVDEAPLGFTCDDVKVKTILRNLVTNAVKFTARGRIEIRSRLAADGALLFEVADTGVGIAPAEIEQIFEPFRQLDGSATRRQGGVGLGLALAQKLARVLGGGLEVQSEPGAGSVFTLRLPPSVVPIGPDAAVRPDAVPSGVEPDRSSASAEDFVGRGAEVGDHAIARGGR